MINKIIFHTWAKVYKAYKQTNEQRNRQTEGSWPWTIMVPFSQMTLRVKRWLKKQITSGVFAIHVPILMSNPT